MQLPNSAPPASREYRERAERGSVDSYRPEEDRIIADCEEFGWKINSVGDIAAAWTMARKDRFFDPRLPPVLAKHLEQQHPEMTMRGLLLALSQREARPYVFSQFAEIFVSHQHLPRSNQTDLAANGLVEMATPADAETLKQLVLDRANSDIRTMFVPIIAKFEKERAILTLRSLLDDKPVT
jgi:hypothetical protein